MSTKNPVRQHYIPELLLRNFLDDKGLLWVYDKDQEKIYPTTEKNAFVIKDMYTAFRFEHIEKNTEFEIFINSIIKDYRYETKNLARDIESKAAPAISRIIEKVRSNGFPQLSEDQANNWKRFMLSMARRTPESRKRATSISDDDAFYIAAKACADKINYNLPNKEILYQDPRVLKLKELLMANVHAKFSAGDSSRERKEEDRFCRETGICVAVISNPRPKNGFLIGSHGLAIVQSHLSNNSIEGSWLPIAHDVAVLATSAPDKEHLLVINHKRTYVVEEINAASALQSNIIVGKSEELVRAFIAA